MRRRTDSEFRIGQQVYDESREPTERYGAIIHVNRYEQTVEVKFTGPNSVRTVEYDFDRIRDTWNPSNNTWDVI